MSLLSVQFVNKHAPGPGASTVPHSHPSKRSVIFVVFCSDRRKPPPVAASSVQLQHPYTHHSNAFVTAFVLVSVLVKSLNSSFSAYSPFSSHRPLVVDFNSLRLLSLARFVASLALSDCASRPGSLVTLSEHWIALPMKS
ncbi:uncharacterized protein PITG_11305 [Phytophthora infestans T30-4]|uniref:Uncharacterized protein n=1 Tax=Phytophthora infestans (strain T30-4) TaxID=403677 RepID=D0NGQ2_PHYIT|nr:uncharacterized protein PITG_11305 [Phytophthora infestans T30-4]EEY57453.1 hypothetical protein PITG_11305 [Phytophthora infestans T30-4]|eukprot:XP_002902063.1 hypothetical protein PITG_11305 [Phytophthora infestans T30-4]